jgi:hypothetical protein
MNQFPGKNERAAHYTGFCGQPHLI